MKSYYLLLLVSILLSCSSVEKQDVDLIITNASIWTGNTGTPSASTLIVNEGKFLAVGEEDLTDKYESKKTIDLDGRFVVPGFIDSHVHFLSGGFGLSSVKLRDASTPEEFSNRIGEYAKTVPENTWVLEGDWDHQLWGGELPKASWIDEMTPDHPVFVTRLDGHISLANSKAMELAGIDRNTPDVEGGDIVRDENGTPTGIFKDNAQYLITKVITEPTPEQNDKAIIDAMNFVASKGVTTVHNMDRVSPDIIDKYKRVIDQQITRFYMAVELEFWRELKKIVEDQGTGDQWLKIGVLKGMVDGALGSHTAAFFDPYTDDPSDKGFFLLPEDSLYDRALNADKAGLHLAIHAIGDRAINTLLNVFEKVIEENGPRERRFRIEHAQHLSPDDIVRFQKLGVIASMQPYHAIDDGRWAEKVIGSERIKTTYAFKSLLDAGARVAFGSDWAVAPPTPLEGICGAVTRQTIDGKNLEGWVPEQRITVEQALKAYTIEGAYASFEEDVKGSIETGKLADFVVLGQNLLTIDPTDIKNVDVISTYVGGKEVYSNPD